MGATAVAEQIKPKDLEVGAYVRIDGLEGEVVKNDKKGGRLTILDADNGRGVVKYRDVVEVEIVQPDDEPIGAETAEELASQVKPDALRFPTAQELEAERQAAIAAKKARAKSSPKPGGSRKYPEEITDAVRRAKAARGTTNGAPGAKQHVHARQVVEISLDNRGPSSWSGIMVAVDPAHDYTDKRAEKLLRDLADGTADKEKLKVLRPLAQRMTDPFCKGRNLASILVAWGEQIQTAADVAKVKAAK